MPKLSGGGGDESLGGGMKCQRGEGVEVSTTIAAKDHGLGAKVLTREAKRVKLNGTKIVNSKTMNRNQVFDNVGNE
jgi:hypothetical protein